MSKFFEMGRAWKAQTPPALKIAAKCCVGFLVAMLVFSICFPSSDEEPGVNSATPLMTSVAGTNPKSLERKFISWIEPVKAARNLRAGLLAQTRDAIDGSFYQVASAISPDDFSDTALGLTSMWKVSTNDSSHRDWLRQNLRNQVVDGGDIEAIVRTRMESLQAEYQSIAQQLATMVGSDLAPPSVTPIEFGEVSIAINAAIESAVSESKTASMQAPGEAIGNMVLSGIAGALAESAARAWLGGDSKDSKTSNISSGVGFATGMATDYVMTQAIGSKSSLAERVSSILRSKLNSLRLGGADAFRWVGPLESHLKNHEIEIENWLIEAAGVSPEWATVQLR